MQKIILSSVVTFYCWCCSFNTNMWLSSFTIRYRIHEITRLSLSLMQWSVPFVSFCVLLISSWFIVNYTRRLLSTFSQVFAVVVRCLYGAQEASYQVSPFTRSSFFSVCYTFAWSILSLLACRYSDKCSLKENSFLFCLISWYFLVFYILRR